MTQYYVSTSASGSDNGLSSGAPWTFAQLLAASLSSSDLVTLKAGDSFSGTLVLQSGVTYDIYGTGSTATIAGGASSAVTATNVGGWTLDHLTLTSDVPASDGTGGPRAVVAVSATSTSGTRYTSPTITLCTITGGQCGINFVGPSTATDGFTAPQITSNAISNATEFGMYLQEAGSTNNHQHYTDAYIAGNTVTNITGDSVSGTASGCGIVLGNCQAGTIEKNLVTDCGAVATQNDAGPGGIFPIYCDQTVIQKNIVARMHTAGGIDGAGIGGDLATTKCIFQDNYIFDCDGSGFYNISRTPGSENTFRFNFVVNCALTLDAAIRDQNGGIWHNNTIVTRLAQCFSFVSGSQSYNNAYYHQGALIGAAATGSVMDGNLYYTTSGTTFSVTYNSINYTSLSAFRTGSGQENFGSTARGFNADPLLYDPYCAVQVSTETQRAALVTGKGLSGSPLLAAGLNLNSLFSINPGTVDFNGNSIASVPYAIGAFNTQGTRPSGSDLNNTVLSLAPMIYNRFDDSSGTIAADSSGHNFQNAYAGGFTLGQASLVTSGTASVLLNGTTGCIAIDPHFIWDHLQGLSGLAIVNGTLSAAGYLLGHWQSTTSSDRVLVTTDSGGHVVMAAYRDDTQVFLIATSANTFTDNATHVFIWTWTGDTFQLWGDGASDAMVYDPSNHNSIAEITRSAGTPRFGASSDASPASFFPGKLQNFALFGQVLNSTQAGALWTASSTSPGPAVVSAATTSSNLTLTLSGGTAPYTFTGGATTVTGSIFAESSFAGVHVTGANATISGSTIVCHLAVPIGQDQTLPTIDSTNLHGLQDSLGTTFPAFTALPVTNSSTLVAATPAGFTLTPLSNHAILSWNDDIDCNTNVATKIYRSTDNITFTLRTTINNSTVHTFDDTTAVSGTPYWWYATREYFNSGHVSAATATLTTSPTLTTIVVDSMRVDPSGTATIHATGYDQVGLPMANQPAFTFSVTVGTGSINSSTGVFTAPSGVENDTVRAASGSVHGDGTVRVALATKNTNHGHLPQSKNLSQLRT